MPKYSDKHLALRIIFLLKDSPRTFDELKFSLNASKGGIEKSLNILKHRGVVKFDEKKNLYEYVQNSED